MDEERERKIRAAWSRVRGVAMKVFEKTTHQFAALLEEFPPINPSANMVQNRFVTDTIVFTHMTDRSGDLHLIDMVARAIFQREMTGGDIGLEQAVKIGDALEEPIPYRVVCEGIIVEEGKYPVRLRC